MPEHQPLEAPLHLAVYAARPDVGAICRCTGRRSPPSATWRRPAAAARVRGMVEPVAFWDDPDLVAAEPAAGRVAAALGGAPAMLLAGNGGLTVGRRPRPGPGPRLNAWRTAAGSPWPPATGAGRSTPRRWPPPPLVRRETARLARWLRATAHDRPGSAEPGRGQGLLEPGVDHSSTTRILDAFRYQTRWV